MVNLSSTIIAKSDQMNAADLLAGPVVITITKVAATGAKDQPTAIHYQGGDGKPYKPCLSMRRVLVWAWGSEGDDYVGRQLTLFNDPEVEWAGQKEGGIRISHMSHIKDDGLSLMLQGKRGSKKSRYTVKPLKVPTGSTRSETEGMPEEDAATKWANSFVAMVIRCENLEAIDILVESKEAKIAELKEKRPDLYGHVQSEIAATKETFKPKTEALADDEF